MAIGFKSIGSLTAERNLGKATSDLGASFERLSSGQRINKASDDAAGLAVSTSLNVGARVFSQGIRNANDGISFLNVGEGAINQLKTITIRQKELAEQSSNGVYSATQRDAMQKEVSALTNEYNRIVSSTQFNGISILNPQQAGATTNIQAGFGINGGLSFSSSGQIAQASGQGVVTLAQTFSFGSGTVFSFADFNHDGFNDLLIPEDSPNRLSLYLGSANGTYSAGVSVSDITSGYVADINGDGNLDLLAGGNFLLGRGDGTFGAANSSGIGGQPVDFDGDAKSELFTYGGGTYSFYEYSGGTFNNFLNITAPLGSISFGDINGDGKKELVRSSGSDSIVYWNARSGSLSGSQVITGLSNAQFKDLNQDGFDDAYVYSGGFTSVRYGTGNGTFSSSISAGAGQVVGFADFNRDNVLDLITDQGTTILGKADGSFAPPISTYQNGVVLIGDSNRDGVADLIVRDFSGTSVSIFTSNTSVSSTISDSDISSAGHARNTLGVLEDRFSRLNSQLASIGAAQSRLSTTVSNLASSKEGYLASAARITDVDVATESARLIRNQILQNVSSQVLGLVNLQPKIVLRLITQVNDKD